MVDVRREIFWIIPKAIFLAVTLWAVALGAEVFYQGRWVYDYPNIKQWTDSMQSAMDLGPALYLPGHGEPFKTDTVKEIIDYYNDLRKGVQAYIDRGFPFEKIQEEFQLPKYKNWRNYNDRFKIHIMVMYNELTGRTKKFYDIK